MQQISRNEVIGNFEAAYEDDLKAGQLRSQANEIGKKITERLNDFAKDIEASKSQVKEAYKRYKSLREKKLSVDDEDYYTLMTHVDEYFQEEESE